MEEIRKRAKKTFWKKEEENDGRKENGENDGT